MKLVRRAGYPTPVAEGKPVSVEVRLHPEPYNITIGLAAQPRYYGSAVFGLLGLPPQNQPRSGKLLRRSRTFLESGSCFWLSDVLYDGAISNEI